MEIIINSAIILGIILVCVIINAILNRESFINAVKHFLLGSICLLGCFFIAFCYDLPLWLQITGYIVFVVVFSVLTLMALAYLDEHHPEHRMW